MINRDWLVAFAIFGAIPGVAYVILGEYKIAFVILALIVVMFFCGAGLLWLRGNK